MSATSNQDTGAVVSLGANLDSQHGTPRQTLEKAAETLQSLGAGDSRLSSFWLTEPVDSPPDSPMYTNAVMVLKLNAEETPVSFLKKLQHIELEFGRVRSGIVNEARVLDLDLIAFGDEVLDTPELTLPHPLAQGRLFVLLPLQEVCPDFVFPDSHRALDELIASVDEQQLRRLP